MEAVPLLRRKRARSQNRMLIARLNGRLQPRDRGALFEDPLDAHFTGAGLAASVNGGGTLMSQDGEPLYCDIEIAVDADHVHETSRAIPQWLDALGAPRGSALFGEDGEALVRFGSTEGLALYLNGTDLPAEVYASNDVNELIE